MPFIFNKSGDEVGGHDTISTSLLGDAIAQGTEYTLFVIKGKDKAEQAGNISEQGLALIGEMILETLYKRSFRLEKSGMFILHEGRKTKMD